MESVVDKIFVGIDPGKEGALTIIYPDGSIETKKFPQIGTEYDIQEMKKIFQHLAITECHIALEDVKALQKPYESGNWSLSRGKAIIETLMVAYDISHTLVHSKTWQKEMWQGVPEQRGPSKTVKTKNGVVKKKGSLLTKEMSLLAAKKLFPKYDLRDPDRKTDRAKAPHDGLIDSLLIAEYCRRKFK